MDHQEENRPPQEDYRLMRKAKSILTIRCLAMFYAFYMLLQLVLGFARGGADAPSVGLLILGIVFLGGGGIAIGIWALRLYRKDCERAKMPPEEAIEQGEEE